MLAHQLHVLPTLTDFWDDLEALFGWLGETAVPLELAPVSHSGNEDKLWQPPATVWNCTDEARVPLEPIRFAGANHLCVQLGYQGSKRLVEPYSLRCSGAGYLLLHCVASSIGNPAPTGLIGSDRIDRCDEAAFYAAVRYRSYG